jgi:23S rRNA pseudouridine1911/1915/1917 synthase
VRLHLTASGLTLVGDALYKPRHPASAVPEGARLGRLALHAATLAVTHPEDGRPLTFEAPLAADMAGYLERHR